MCVCVGMLPSMYWLNCHPEKPQALSVSAEVGDSLLSLREEANSMADLSSCLCLVQEHRYSTVHEYSGI